MSHNLKDDGFQIANTHCYCIAFHFERRRRAFQSNQLIEFTLEENPDAKVNQNTPPEKLSLAFSTADVTILGWRLSRLADYLQENKLAAVGTLPKRSAGIDPSKPFVSSIVITPVTKP